MDEEASNLEDWRGVDIGQIRRQLELPVPDRVRVMVESANLFMAIQEHARAARNAKAG
jgi:cell division protein FtsX